MRTDGLCCMREHANAVPPWTCGCECHNQKGNYILDNLSEAGYTDAREITI
jgi:hypothetical protein